VSDQPTAEIAGQTETSNDNLIPPGAEGAEVDEVGGSDFEVAKLAAYLQGVFPEEWVRSNRQRPEGPVDMAIRLLQGFVAASPASVLERCPEEYCNQPKGHGTVHGWVHNG
jgi:hypothetical protein